MTQITNCFDGHVHWRATGSHPMRLNLSDLESPEKVKDLSIESHHYRQDWLVGFGWDDNKWNDKSTLHRHTLDQLFPDTPVALTRADGHAKWVNTKALVLAGLPTTRIENNEVPGGRIEVDENGVPTGVLIDKADDPINRVIPPESDEIVRGQLLKGAQVFNKAGFTHIRDLTCDEQQWSVQKDLDEKGQLTVAVEQFFNAEDKDKFSHVVALAERARREQTDNLRVKGIKVYLDGALGSEGALLSKCYCSGSGSGLQLMTQAELVDAMKEVWASDFEIAVHAIGDEAAAIAVDAAVGLYESGVRGPLNIEHSEMMRPETIEKLKLLDVTCYMQPCHWLTDRNWIQDKLGDLTRHIFPWQALEQNNIPIFFGSDSPIEDPSLANNLLALKESSGCGIPALLGDPLQYHRHPDQSWTPDTFTEIDGDNIVQTVFRGQICQSLYL